MASLLRSLKTCSQTCSQRCSRETIRRVTLAWIYTKAAEMLCKASIENDHSFVDPASQFLLMPKMQVTNETLSSFVLRDIFVAIGR